MTLNLAVKLTLDKAGFAPGAAEASRSVGSIGEAATAAATAAKGMQAALTAGARDATTAAEAQARALQSVAAIAAGSATRTKRDSLGLEIGRSSAETAADVARLAGTVETLRQRWDPVEAATARYRAGLAELNAAHQLGAVSIETYMARETELRAAMERTTAAIAARAQATKAAAERTVAAQTIVPDRGADIAAYGAQLDALRARYNPVWAAGQQYKAGLAEIRSAERVGAISAAEAAAAASRLRTQTGEQVAALRAASAAHTTNAGAMKLSAFQAQNLSYQLNDVFVSLAAGMNPLTVAVQQGSQIAPIFGGVRGTLSAVAGVLNPVTVGVAAAAAATGIAAKAGLDYSAAMRDADLAAQGLGRNVGTTAGQIEQMARSSAVGAGLSISDARSVATELTRTGKIGTDNFAGLIGVTKSFARVLGTDVPSAASTLAEIMADPAQGAQRLSRDFGLVDTATQRLVQRLADQGRRTEAQAVLTSALTRSIGGAVGATTEWGRAWESVATWASNAYDAIGRAVSRSASSETGASVRKEIEALQRGRDRATPGSNVQREFDEEIARRQGRLKELESQEADARARADAADRDRMGAAGVAVAGSSSSQMVQEAMRRRQLTTDLDTLRNAQAAPNLGADEEARIETAIEAKTRALSTWISESERSRELAEIDIAMAQARDPIERAELERRRALVSAAGQEMTAAEAAASANLAYARSIGEAVAAARGSIADAAVDVAARTRVNALVASGAIATGDAARELQIEAQTRQLVAAATRAEGAEKERLLTLADGLRSAMEAQAAAEKRAQTIADVASGRDRLETMQAEIALLGQSTAVRARMLALLEAEQKIRSQGLTGADAAAVRALAVSTADLNTELERQKAAWGEIEQSGSSAVDTIVDGLMHGKDVSKQLVESLLSELGKLAIANPLKNGLFGENLPTIGDIGGLLSGRTQRTAAGGLMSSVATAQITAATVIINGQTVGIGAGIAGAGGNFADGTGGLGAAATVSRSTLGPVGAANSNLIPTEAGRVFATGYSPQSAGDRIEGGLASSIRGPDGQALVRTLDDYRSGRSSYVTLAGNPEFYGRRYTMPEVSYTSGGQQYALRDVPGVVHDTGSAFRTAPEGRFDVAIGQNLSFAERNQSMSSVQFAPAATQASEALTKFSTTAQSTDASLGTLGNSFGGFGQALSQAIGGIGSGGGSSGGGLFGGLLKLLGFSHGGVFAAGSVVPFATGTVVDRPTLFPIAGGKTGLMGEAGSEAIMPLARDSSGRLGVRAALPAASGSTAPAGGVSVSMPVAIHNYAGADVTATMGTRSDGRREMQIQVRRLKKEMESEYGLRRVRTTR